MKPIRTWILIADGARARVLVNEGPGKGLRPVSGAQFEHDVRPAGEIMADRAGRTFDSAGQGRHAMEPTSDPVREEKRRFAEELAQYLDDCFVGGAYERLVLVAAPAALGDLRAALSEPVRKATTGELPKDLTKIPDNKLASHLDDLLVL